MYISPFICCFFFSNFIRFDILDVCARTRDIMEQQLLPNMSCNSKWLSQLQSINRDHDRCGR